MCIWGMCKVIYIQLKVKLVPKWNLTKGKVIHGKRNNEGLVVPRPEG